MSKKRRPRKLETRITIGIFLTLFSAMIIYLCIYVHNNEQVLMSNSYNSRQKILAKENLRGSIYDKYGEVLAYSENNGSTDVRIYPYKNLFSHVVGYHTKGKSGIESFANYYLINSNISLAEKAENDLKGVKNPGNSVYTTLDTNLQKIASDSLGMFKGAIVVSDVKTGAILAMVSKPDFDPSTVDEDWDKYLAMSDDNSVLLNRATQGQYPPGSTFKIITALEYIRENPDSYMNYRYTCNGRYTNGADINISCFHGSTHGEEDFFKSFAKSCNSSFANIGMSLDRDKFGKTLNELLYNEKLPLDINYNISKLTVDSSLSDYDMSQISIGQGNATISPIQLNMITNAIANNGILMKPMFITEVVDANNMIIKEYKAEEYKRLLSEDEATVMKELMAEVVEKGTATKLQSEYYTAAGKTGSAEYNGNSLDSHAWFTGFAPVDDPKVSVTIIVEGVGTGGEYAVPIAKRIIDAYFGVY